MTGRPGIAQQLEADWDHLTARLHHQAPKTSAAAAAATTTQPEEHMSAFIDGLDHFLADARTVGEDVFDNAKALMATPDGAALFKSAVNLAKWAAAGHIAPGVLSGALAGIKTVESLAEGYVAANEQNKQAEQQAAAQ